MQEWNPYHLDGRLGDRMVNRCAKLPPFKIRSRVRIILLCILFNLFSMPAFSQKPCPDNCMEQYQAQIKFCNEQVIKEPRKKGAWYTDCKKYAEKFRKECLSKCL